MNALLRQLNGDSTPIPADFLRLVDAFKDPVLLIRTDGRVLYANPACSILSGYSRDEILNTPDLADRIIHPDCREQFENFWKTFRSLGALPDKPTEWKWVRKDGRTFFTENHFSGIFDDMGDPVGVQTVARDITERKQFQAQYQRLVDELNDGVFVVTREGIITFANRALANIYGLDDPAELIGKNFQDMLAPEAKEQIREEFEGRMRGQSGSDVVVAEIVRKDGSRGWSEIKPVLIRESGKIIGARGVVRDIPERRKTDALLIKLSNAVKNSADAILITDVQGVIEFVNPAFEKLTGYTKEEVAGKKPSVLGSGLHPEQFYKDLWATILSGQTFRATLTNRKKNGELYYQEQTISPVLNELASSRILFRRAGISRISGCWKSSSRRLRKWKPSAGWRAESPMISTTS
jgi:PAS domain S-box-containing protein